MIDKVVDIHMRNIELYKRAYPDQAVKFSGRVSFMREAYLRKFNKLPLPSGFDLVSNPRDDYPIWTLYHRESLCGKIRFKGGWEIQFPKEEGWKRV